MTGSFDLRGFSARNLARSTSARGFNHQLMDWSLSDWMVATLGELGEAANVLKKLNRVRDRTPGNAETPQELEQALADEIADTYIYLDLFCQAASIDLPTAITSKFERTSKKIGYEDSRPRAPGHTDLMISPEAIDEVLACGHHHSLGVRNVESGEVFCEFCEMRSERNDALKMEEHNRARAEAAEAKLAKAREALEKSRVFVNAEFLRRASGDDESYDEDEQAIPLLNSISAALKEIGE